MKKLNDYQLKVLLKGAQEEVLNGVHINSYPKNETLGLIERYYALTKKDIPAAEEEEGELVVEALLSLFDFWACYFTLGAETAFQIKKKLEEELLTRLNAICESIEARRLSEVF